MDNVAIILVEIGLIIIMFLLVLSLTTFMMTYYQKSTETLIGRMMDNIEEDISGHEYSNREESDDLVKSLVGTPLNYLKTAFFII